MRYPDFSNQAVPENEVRALPQTCPACSSSTIVTTAKVPSSRSYWRCVNCGEVWTPDRRQTQSIRRWPR